MDWQFFAYLAGFILTWLWMDWVARSRGLLSRKDVALLVPLVSLSTIIGARVGSLLFWYPSDLFIDPFELFRIWNGGMSFHGGFIGAAICLWLFSRWKRIRYFELTDAILLPAAVIQFLGRVGNFLVGELFGKPSALPWAMAFPLSGDSLPRHPSQLYEAAYNLVLISFVLAYNGVASRPGWLTGVWLMGYAIFRSLAEFVRAPVLMVGPLTIGQVLCVPLFFVGLWLVIRRESS